MVFMFGGVGGSLGLPAGIPNCKVCHGLRVSQVQSLNRAIATVNVNASAERGWHERFHRVANFLRKMLRNVPRSFRALNL